MMQWQTLFQKELLENWRNKKWLWVPLVLMTLTIMDPISYYFLPEIMESIGDVPEGMVLEMPAIEPEAALMMSIESLSMYGALVIVLISIGTIASERQQGITEMMLAKPIRFINYVTAKWASFVLLAIISLLLSLCMSWYYTNLLFGSVSITTMILVFIFYSIWYMFIVTLSIFYNTFCKNAGVVIAYTIGTLAILSGINALIGHRFTWFPNQLAHHIGDMLTTSSVSTALLGTAGVLVLIILILITASIQICRRKEMI